MSEDRTRSDLERYRDLTEQALDLIAELDGEGSFLYTSPSHETVLGYETGSLLGTCAFDLIHPDDLSDTLAIFDHALRTRAADEAECRLRTRKGGWRWFHIRGRPFDNGRGDLRVALVGRDVSARVAAEQALRHSEQRHRILVETARCGIVESDRAGRITLANRGMAELVGVPVEELRGRGIWELFAEASERQHTRQRISQTLVEQPEPRPRTHHLAGPDGARLAVEIDWNYRRDETGAILGFVSVFTDVTQHQRAGVALAESQRFLTQLAETSPTNLCVFDLAERRVRYTNLRNTAQLGWTPRQLREMGARVFDELIHPEDRGTVARAMIETLGFDADDDVVDAEYRIRDAWGQWHWVLGRFTVFTRDAEGHPREILSAQVDVSEQHRALDALRAQEERFRLLAENAGDIIFEFDVDGRLLFISPSWTTLTGHPVEPVLEAGLGWLVQNVMSPEQTGWFEPGNIPLFRDGQVPSRVFRLRHADGSDRWFEARSSLFETVEGETRGITIARDVSDRVCAEEKLRAREARFRLVAEGAHDYILELGPDGEVSYLSPSFREILGFDPDSFSARDAFEQLHEDERDHVVGELRRLLAGERIGPLVYRHRHRSGTWRWLETYGTPRPMADGRHAGVAITRDITEKVEAEAEARRLHDQLLQAQKLESLGVLAGGIAHDFNNLLVGILGNASMALSECPMDSPMREVLEGIETAALRAGDLTGQMLAYSGKGRFVVEPLDVNALVREMAHLLEASISKKTKLRLTLDARLRPVEGDATQLRQLVMNLITNGSDAVGDGAGVVELRTRHIPRAAESEDWTAEGSAVLLEVRDTGCGMDPETLQRIFDPFFTTKFTGRGLGLAAALGIVRGHRGTIDVHSQPTAGTCFRVLLPTCERQPLPLASSAAQAEPSHVPPARGTILVTDDEEVVRRMARRILEGAGFQVLTAEDGFEAIERFRNADGQVAAVLLDLTMPRLGGEETLHALREIRPDVPVVLTSGYAESEIAVRFEGVRLEGFLQKPFRPAQLLERVRAALEPR